MDLGDCCETRFLKTRGIGGDFFGVVGDLWETRFLETRGTWRGLFWSRGGFLGNPLFGNPGDLEGTFLELGAHWETRFLKKARFPNPSGKNFHIHTLQEVIRLFLHIDFLEEYSFLSFLKAVYQLSKGKQLGEESPTLYIKV